jgi:hypothetical protein
MRYVNIPLQANSSAIRPKPAPGTRTLTLDLFCRKKKFARQSRDWKPPLRSGSTDRSSSGMWLKCASTASRHGLYVFSRSIAPFRRVALCVCACRCQRRAPSIRSQIQDVSGLTASLQSLIICLSVLLTLSILLSFLACCCSPACRCNNCCTLSVDRCVSSRVVVVGGSVEMS